MRMDREGHKYPPYVLRPDLEMAKRYLESQGGNVDLSYVPLSYMVFLRGEAHGVELFKDLDIPRKQALFAGQRYEWFAPLQWNVPVRVESTVKRISAKDGKNGKLWFADIELEYFDDKSGSLLMRETARIVKKGS